MENEEATTTTLIERAARRYGADPAEVADNYDRRRQAKNFQPGYEYRAIDWSARDAARSEARRREAEEQAATDRSLRWDPQREQEARLRFSEMIRKIAEMIENEEPVDAQRQYVRDYLSDRIEDIDLFRIIVLGWEPSGEEPQEGWDTLIDMALCYGRYWYEFGYDQMVFTAFVTRHDPIYCARKRCRDMFIPQRKGTRYCENHRR